MGDADQTAVDQISSGQKPNEQVVRFDLSAAAEAGNAAAATAIADGKCVVLPTDTVYGIGANAFSSEAVAGLLAAKHRGRDMPPPVLIADPAMLPAMVEKVPAGAQALVDAFWPGALTLILKAQPGLNLDLGNTRGTVAVRVPDSAPARELLRATGPMAVSSANVSGQDAATEIDSAIDQLGASVAVYLDGGPTPGNVPSTIVDFVVTPNGRIVRHGVLTTEQLREAFAPIEDPDEAEATDA